MSATAHTATYFCTKTVAKDATTSVSNRLPKAKSTVFYADARTVPRGHELPLPPAAWFSMMMMAASANEGVREARLLTSTN